MKTDIRNIEGEFIVQLNKKTMEELGVKRGSLVVLTNKLGGRKLSVLGYVHTPDNSLHENEIKVDQTLRNAIGIFSKNPKIEIEVSKSTLQRGFGYKLTNLLAGYQNEVVRIFRQTRIDMEKSVCRVPKEVLLLIGTTEGGTIEIESCSERIKRRVLPFTPTIKAEFYKRKKKEAIAQLKKYEDIPPILLDYEARKMLGVDVGDPVIIRRDFSDVVYRHSTPIVLSFLLMAVSLAISLPLLYSTISVFIIMFFMILLIFSKMKKEVTP